MSSVSSTSSALSASPGETVDDIIARLQKHIELEKQSDYRPRLKTDVPASVEDVNEEWLTSVLCEEYPGAKVESVAISGGSDGSTSRRRLHVSYNDIGAAAGLPTKLFGKATPHLQNRLVCGLSGAIFNESNFYNIVRPQLTIEAPISYYANGDADSFRSLMLFEDMSDTGTVFPDPSYYIERAKAEDMVCLIANFHAHLWENPILDQLEGLKTPLQFQQDVNVGIAFEERSNIGIDRAGAVISDAIRSRKSDMWNANMASLALNVALPSTLVHFDVHIGNWYVTGDGAMGLTDWQCIVRGHGVSDLAYAVCSALTIDDRRAWERDLVTLYIEKLKENGVKDALSFDDYWRYYRQQMFHGFYNWVYTIGAGEMQPNMQPDDISLVNIERMAAAIDDLESYSAVVEDR